MSILTALRRSLRALMPATLFLLGVAASPRALALVNDELLPANLVGKTLTFTYGAGTPNTLEAINNFTLQFTSASTYVRSATGLATEGGTYSVLDSSIAASTGGRATTIQINNNWFSPGSTTAVLLVLTQFNGLGGYAASELFNPAKTTGGLFTISGSGGGGGGTTPIPSITSAFQASATVGTPFTYQIVATNSPTSYGASTLPAGLTINTTTGLISGTPTGNATTASVTISATNAGGSTTIPITITIAAGSGGGGGGATAAPVITSGNPPIATVGTAFSYQVTASNTPTSFFATGLPPGLSINVTTGLVSGTPTTGGTFTPSINATNAGGTGTRIVTLTVSGPTGIASYAGTYSGGVFQRINGVTAILGGATYSAFISTAGAVTITVTNAGSSTTLTGTISAGGAITLNGGTGLVIYRITSATVTASGSSFVLSSPFFAASTSSTGAITEYALQNSTAFVAGGGGTTTFAAAPTNLVGYRNKVGQTFQFTVTGSTGGIVWGSDVYTDDSTVARAAVHAGVLAVGETKTVTITILGGQTSYAASTRNGVTTSSWPAWPGSYAFSGSGGGTATARPAVASGFVAGTSALAAGGRFVCPITVSGGGTYTYQWYLNGVIISGATLNPYVVESLTAANAGVYTVDVTNALGTSRLSAGTLTVGATGSPVIALQPISKIVVPGATVSFATSATGSGLSYQWFRNNVALAGETGAILLRNNVNAADAGTYTVRITNSAGSVTSAGGVLTLSASASRPANISVRTNSATGAIVTPGFVLQGSGTKRVLIRAVGPGLTQFGLTGVMADPKFTVFQGQTQIATNDDWNAANIGQAFVATGAFGITAGSKDAALVTDLAAGKDYTVQVTNATGTGGIVLIEVYDADALVGTSTSKLVNVSVRGQTAPGADVLTLGLVIGGTGQRTLLVRGIGPTLAGFGVTGTVADPRLQIFDSQQRAILGNDDWGSADFVNELGVATTYVGAFALAAGSKDAATLSLVDPGAYTIQVSGSSASPTGEALVEVYEVP